MIISKGIKVTKIITWTGPHALWLFAYMGTIALLYSSDILKITIPWLPMTVIGTAVAFFVGFKNNQSYDRLWEARKIWGGIVNDSRTWGMMVDGYLSKTRGESAESDEEIHAIKKRLIYRHIAWLYAHRSNLLVPTPWEHVSQGGSTGKSARLLKEHFGLGTLENDVTRSELVHFLPDEELDRLLNSVNTATQIINEQSRDLAKLRDRGLFNDFRHVEMVDVLRSFYTLQGKNERIKKFPFPRQYANLSRYFVGIFVLLLPFTMVPELMAIGKWGIQIAIFVATLIGWVYVMMEIVGDHSENPFAGMANDIPMLSLCRTIEIDLREMLGETDLPPNIEPVNNILM